jgi:ribonuclease P protein subunit RPR2
MWITRELDLASTPRGIEARQADIPRDLEEPRRFHDRHDPATKSAKREQERRLSRVLGFVALSKLAETEAENASRVTFVQALERFALSDVFAAFDALRTTDRRNGGQARPPPGVLTIGTSPFGRASTLDSASFRPDAVLTSTVSETTVYFRETCREAASVLAKALESKDPGITEHSQRVSCYARELVNAVDSRLLDDQSLAYGFLLHDVGKIAIPDAILMKPAPLTATEARLMQTHTVLGEQIVAEVTRLHGEGLTLVRSHHERWDGRGYPDGLAGNAIALSARVFAIVDALDAMTSDRTYRRAGQWTTAVTEIVRGAGSQFDPRIVSVFMEREPKLRSLCARLAA